MYLYYCLIVELSIYNTIWLEKSKGYTIQPFTETLSTLGLNNVLSRVSTVV